MTLTSFLPLLLVLVVYLLFWDMPKTSNRNRTFLSVLSVALGVTYLSWRWIVTVWLPPELGMINQAWVLLLFVVEVLAFIEVATFLWIMSRTNERSQEADQLSALQRVPVPSVDVFIPTYNAPIDVLEKTIICAKNIDWPNKKLWVLDDGQRDWLRAYCAERDVGYLTRTVRSHAKAGNLNEALLNTTGEFICIFDADFVPFPAFIRRTIGFSMTPRWVSCKRRSTSTTKIPSRPISVFRGIIRMNSACSLMKWRLAAMPGMWRSVVGLVVFNAGLRLMPLVVYPPKLSRRTY